KRKIQSQARVPRLDVCALIPVVVRGDDLPARVVQLERGITKRAVHTERGERRAERADEHLLVAGALHDEAGDGHAVAGFHLQTRGDVAEVGDAGGGGQRQRCEKRGDGHEEGANARVHRRGGETLWGAPPPLGATSTLVLRFNSRRPREVARKFSLYARL